MNLRFPKGFILFLSLLIIPLVSQGQQKGSKSRPKIGLALSGGGAKGFAHIGMLKVLTEEGIPIDRISGASMGAIVGALYSIGYTPRQIEQIALNSDWPVLFNDNYRINPRNISNSVSSKDTYLLTFPFDGKHIRLPLGLINGQNVSMFLYRLMLPYQNVTDFTKLPVPFSAVATDLATGKAHTFTHGYLPEAVRASSAIPAVFKPVQIDGKTYVDGGVSRSIPVEDVQNLGADIVIASDVGEPVKPLDQLHTFLDVMNQSIGFRQKESDIKQINKADFYVRPDIEEFSSFSYDQAEEIINRGEEATRKIIPALKEELKEKVHSRSSPPPISASRNDILLISDVSFGKIKGLLKRQVHLIFNIQTPHKLSITQIEAKVNRLYNTGLFDHISYRLLDDSTSEGKKLMLTFQKKEQQHVGFGARYDSQYGAALLFGATLTNTFLQTDRLTARLRVGDAFDLSTHYSALTSLKPFSQLHFRLGFQRSPIDFYNQSQALSTIEVERLKARASGSLGLFSHTTVEGGLSAEVFNLNEAIGNTFDFGDSNFLIEPFFYFNFNTLNQPYFPMRGQEIALTSEYSDKNWGSISTFLQMTAHWKNAVPLFKGLSLSNNLFAGYSSSNIPFHYYYYLGGLTTNPLYGIRQLPFMGYATQQLRASNMLLLRSQLQWRITRSLYLSGGANVAHLSNKWTFNLSKKKLDYGYSLSVGATTLVGPAILSVSTPDFKGGYALKLKVGYEF